MNCQCTSTVVHVYFTHLLHGNISCIDMCVHTFSTIMAKNEEEPQQQQQQQQQGGNSPNASQSSTSTRSPVNAVISTPTATDLQNTQLRLAEQERKSELGLAIICYV